MPACFMAFTVIASALTPMVSEFRFLRSESTRPLPAVPVPIPGVLVVPGAPGSKLEGSKSTKSFPLQERNGIIFAYVGDSLHPEAPEFVLPSLAEDEYYAFELVGLAVEEEGGRFLGRVADVVDYPANDVLELDSGLSLPLVEACVRKVDLDGGRIVVTAGFAEPE